MNTQTIKRFFGKANGKAIAFYIFAALTVLCVAGYFISGLFSGKEPVAITTENEEAELYGYVDIEILTDWFGAYQDDSLFWHVGGTPEGYLYVVAMEKSLFDSQFQAAYDYCYDEDDTSLPPAAVRATGVLKPLDSELIEMGAEFMGWTEEQFRSQCGTLYLDTTLEPETDNESRAIFLGIAFLAGIFTLAFSIEFFTKRGNIKKTMQRLAAAGAIDLAAAELEQPPVFSLDNGKVVFTKHYIANAVNGMIVPFGDVLWAYITVQRTNFVATGQCLTVRTAQKQSFNIAQDQPGKRARGITKAAIEELARRCPDILLGYSNDNNVEFNKRVAAIQNGTWHTAASAGAATRQPGYSAPASPAAPYSSPISAEEYYKDSDPTIK